MATQRSGTKTLTFAQNASKNMSERCASSQKAADIARKTTLQAAEIAWKRSGNGRWPELWLQTVSRKKKAFNRLEAGSFPKLPTKDKMDPKPFSAQERIEEARNPNSMSNIIQRAQIQERVIEELREAYTKQEKFIKIVMTEMRRELPEQKWKMILKDYEAVTENGKS